MPRLQQGAMAMFLVERTCVCHLEGIREISLNSVGALERFLPLVEMTGGSDRDMTVSC